MKKTKVTTQALAFGALLALGAVAGAQAGNYSISGRGELTLPDRTERVTNLTLNLERDGDFTLRIDADRNHSLSGRWTERSNNVVSLSVRSGFGRSRLSGGGTANLGSNRRLQSVSVSGLVDNRRYRLEFDGRDELRRGDVIGGNGRWTWDDDWNRTRQMRTTRSGRGTLRVTGRRDRQINEATVNLERDGDASVRIEGRDFNETFTGSWTGGRSNVVNLNVRRSSDDSSTRGTGHIVLDNRNGFREIHISGTTDRRETRYSVSFNASASGWDQDDRWNRLEGRYEDNQRWNSGRQTYEIRYDLVLERDGDAVLFIDADRDIEETRSNLRNYGTILRHVNRLGDARISGRWRESGDRVVVDLGPTTIDGRRITTTLRGHLVGSTIWFDEFDRDLFGHEVDMSFERD